MDAARRSTGGRGKGHWYGRIFSFLGPLSVLGPLPTKGGVNPREALKKDWSLTWLALSLAPESLLIGGMQYWLQYAAGKFYWSTEMVGMSLNRNWSCSKKSFLGWILYKRHWIHSSTLLGDRVAW